MFHIWWDVQKFSQSPEKKEIMIFSCCQSPFFENCDVDQVPNILIIVMFVRKFESHEDLPLLTCLSFIIYPRNDWKEILYKKSLLAGIYWFHRIHIHVLKRDPDHLLLPEPLLMCLKFVQWLWRKGLITYRRTDKQTDRQTHDVQNKIFRLGD